MEWPAPRRVTVTYEDVSLNATGGDAMVSGKPSAYARDSNHMEFHGYLERSRQEL